MQATMDSRMLTVPCLGAQTKSVRPRSSARPLADLPRPLPRLERTLSAYCSSLDTTRKMTPRC